MTVAFLTPGLVAVGDTDSVKRGIDGVGGANITSNKELMDLVRDIDDSNAWAVGRFDALITPRRTCRRVSPARFRQSSGSRRAAM